MKSTGILALGVSLPETIRTNDDYRRKQPELVADAERRALSRLWSRQGARPPALGVWDAEMEPYLGDPFRGTVERRVLAPGETALSMEIRAASLVLSAASLRPGDVDLAIVVSFLPDQLGVGNSAFLARELGLACAAWNLESACSGALVALQTACALVSTGRHANALVVVSCSYSRYIDERDTLGWFLGDAAAAFLVGATPPGVGLLGTQIVHTAATCGSFYYDHLR
jgi:3-oxoacyl-[acyl-carrier-protein] synthase-3